MRLDKNSGEIISENKAIELTHAFQDRNPNLNKAYFIGTDKVKLILEQKDCIGIRIYDGLKTNIGEDNRVLVGVNSSGEDIVDGIIADELISCPVICPNKSSLLK